MRREIQAPFTSHYFETTDAERAGKGSVRLERGSGSFALSIADQDGTATEWRVRVQVKMADAGAGLVDLGAVRTVPPSKGSPPSRLVCFLSVPGAVGFMCDFTAAAATPLPAATVGFGECPYIGEMGLVASQFADRETDRYQATGGVLAAGVATVTLNPAAGLVRRVWAIGVFQVGTGGLVSAPYPMGGTPPGTIIPISPNGSLNLHPGGALVLPVSFDVNMPAGGGGWFAEWGE